MHYALPKVELHEFRVLLYIQPVQVLPDGTKTVRCIIYSFQLCVTSKMLEDTLCPIIQIKNRIGTSVEPWCTPLVLASNWILND